LPPRKHFREEFVRPFGLPNALDLIGEAPETWRMLDELAFAARMGGHVLLRGETGTGKEPAARAIRLMGPEAAGPYIAISAGNVPPGLVEDALFGHVKNVTHSGMGATIGVVGQADGGILFLDEIARLSEELQIALLRVLDGGDYRQVGGQTNLTSRFRLIAALNREPERLIRDLRGRMAHTVWLPTLANRREDIPLLLRPLLAKAAAKAPDLVAALLTKQADGTTEIVPPVELLDRLMRVEAFEGNIRDLESALNEQLRGSPDLRPPALASVPAPARTDGAESPDPDDESSGPDLTAERIEWCLTQTDGNVKAAADLAGVSRPALYRAMERLGMKWRKEE
jgi:two-component system nitrogen regulation response regulator GlnG/two-component system response regulator HydG